MRVCIKLTTAGLWIITGITEGRADHAFFCSYAFQLHTTGQEFSKRMERAVAIRDSPPDNKGKAIMKEMSSLAADREALQSLGVGLAVITASVMLITAFVVQRHLDGTMSVEATKVLVSASAVSIP